MKITCDHIKMGLAGIIVSLSAFSFSSQPVPSNHRNHRNEGAIQNIAWNNNLGSFDRSSIQTAARSVQELNRDDREILSKVYILHMISNDIEIRSIDKCRVALRKAQRLESCLPLEKDVQNDAGILIQGLADYIVNSDPNEEPFIQEDQDLDQADHYDAWGTPTSYYEVL